MADARQIAFPVRVADFEGHTVTVELSDGRDPHVTPPGSLEVWVRRPDKDPEKPPVHMVNQAVAIFSRTFAEDEELTTTQAERNELREKLKEATASERALRKELGQLRMRVKLLEAEAHKYKADVRRDMVRAQIRALEALAGDD